MMKRIIILFCLLSAMMVFVQNCAPYKMKAIRAQRDQRFDLAVRYALRHLSSNPNDHAAIQLLNQASQKYYVELQQQINHFERLNNWAAVARIASEGRQRLAEAANIVGTNFPTKSELDFLQSKSEQSKINRAEEVYIIAKRYYQNGDFESALEQFNEVEKYTRHFKDTDQLVTDTRQKLASKSYQQARALVSQGNLESALALFDRTSSYVPDFLDVKFQVDQIKARLSHSSLSQGQSYFDAGDYKNAFHQLKKSLSYQPENSQAAQLFSDAKEKLTVRLAVFPFASSKLDQKFGAIASQSILSRALPARSEFVQFLDRENLQKIFEEQALSQTGAIDEKTAVQVGKISGVNTIVVGSVTLVSHQKSQPTRRTLTSYYDKKYRDPKGVQRTKKESFSYTAFEVSHRVEVNISYRLVSVETGAILANESINRQASDSTEWITCPEDFVEHLSYAERQKIKASKEPKNLESLINQAIESLSQDAAGKILNKVSPF